MCDCEIYTAQIRTCFMSWLEIQPEALVSESMLLVQGYVYEGCDLRVAFTDGSETKEELMAEDKKSLSEIDKKLAEIEEKFTKEYERWMSEKQSESSSKHGNRSTNGGDSASATPDSSKGRRPKANRLETRSELPGQRIHGFENETLFLKNFLLKRKEWEEFKTLAIVGKFGVGKTTLCQVVFNEKDVKQAYVPRIWVSMYSKETKDDEDPKIAVVKRILRSLVVEDEMLEHMITEAKEKKRIKDEAGEREKETVEEKELSPLWDALYSYLFGKKYLIVLDDVWEDDGWNQRHLSCGFPKGFGGRVIVTSRDESVAKKIVGENLQRLFPRSDAESMWKIYKDAFGEPMKDEAGKPKKDEAGEPMKVKVVTDADGKETEWVMNPRYPVKFKRELMDKSGGVPWAAQMLANIEPIKMDEDKDK